jgi:hypothetical protein
MILKFFVHVSGWICLDNLVCLDVPLAIAANFRFALCTGGEFVRKILSRSQCFICYL